MVKTLAQGVFFKTTNDRSLPTMIMSSLYDARQDIFYFEDTQSFFPAELVRTFCHDVVRQVPSVSRCLLLTVRAVNDKMQDPSFLYEFMSLALSGESTMITDEGI